MYALLSALESESKKIIERASNQTIHIWNNYKFVIGIFAGHECIIGHTGIGKVHASIVVNHIIENFHPSVVFYTGIAGALKNDLNIGDVVVAGDSVQWDVDIRKFGFKIGELPSVHTNPVKKNKSRNVRFFNSDPEIISKAERWNPGGFKVKQGRIITGDSFFTTSMQIDYADLVRELNGDAVDMEGAAAGAASAMGNVPFFLSRVISDTFDGKKPKSFNSFMNNSSSKMANLIEYILQD